MEQFQQFTYEKGTGGKLIIVEHKPPKSKSDYSQALIVHVDGGAFVEPPLYKFHDAYFSVVSNTKKLVHFAKNIGNMWSGMAEYEAIKWAVENIKQRPLVILSDCTVAISWAKKGSSIKAKKHNVPKLNLKGVSIKYRHGNYADQWNAENHSPKRKKREYIQRHYKFLQNIPQSISD